MNCINTSSPEFKKLLEETNMKPLLLEANISLYQDKYGVDSWPSKMDLVKVYGNPIDPAKALQWLEDKLGMTQMDVQVMSGLIDGDSMGQFVDDAIILSDMALEGTEYHEAFHRVFNVFLSSSDRAALLLEKQATKGFNEEYAKMKQEYPELSHNRVIEEMLAEDFRMYVLTDKQYNLPPIETSFFNKILNFFKKLLGKDISIKEVYDNILASKYTGSKYLNDYDRSNVYKKKLVLGELPLNAREAKEVLGSMALYINQSIFLKGENLSNFYRENIDITQILNNSAKFLLDNLKYKASNLKGEEAKRFDDLANALEEDFKKGRTSEVLQQLGKYLKSNYGIDLKLSKQSTENERKDFSEVAEDVYDNPNSENKSEETTQSRNALDIRSSIEFNTKDNLPKAIKLLLGSLPKVDKSDSTLGLEEPMDFNKVSNMVINTLVGVPPTIDNFIDALSLKTKIMPELGTLIEYLGPKTDTFIAQNDTVNNDNFYNIKLRGDFVQAFAKTKNTILLQVIKGTGEDVEFTIVDTNVQQTSDTIRKEWDNQLREKNTSVDLLLQKLTNKLLSIKDKYNELGITFSPNVKDSSISNSLDAIIAELENSKKKNGFTLAGFLTDKKSGISGTIAKLSEIEGSVRGDADLQLINTEGKQIYAIGLNTFQSIITDRINYYVDTIKDLDKLEATLKYELPFLFNAYTTNSRWLKKVLQGNKIINALIDGSKPEGEDGEHVSQLKEPDVYALVYNTIAKGYSMAMKHSDRSMYPIYYFPDKSLVVDGDTEEQLIAAATDIMKGYLEDEAARARVVMNNPKYADIQNLSNKGKSPILFPYLDKEWAKIVNGNKVNVDSKISSHLRETIKSEKKKLTDWKVIEFGGVKNNEVDITKSILNAMINHIEETKLFTGDFALYSNPDDYNKRLNTQSSTGDVLIVDKENNYYINKMNNKPRIQTESGLIPYQKYNLGDDSKGLATELVIKDAEFTSRLYDTIKSQFGEKYASVYGKINENDGFSWINMFFYREFEWRASNWTIPKNNTFLQQIKILNGEEAALYTVPDKVHPEDYLRRILEPWTTQKPQYVGPNYGEDIDSYREDDTMDRLGVIAGRKTAYMPLVPSIIKGTVLEEIHKFMLYNGIDVLHTESAAKFGSKKMREFYLEDGSKTVGFNSTEISLNEVGYLDLRFMKNQLKMNNQPKKDISSSTQGRVNILEGIRVNGEYVSPELGKLAEDYQETQSRIIRNKIEKLLKSIDAEPETLQLKNFKKFVDILYEAALDRNSTDNILDAIENWNFTEEAKEFIETKPQYSKLQNILNSLITNRVLIEKRPGDMMAQAAITGMEPIGYERVIRDGKIESSPVLNFYTFNENGSLNPAEIMMPLPSQWLKPLMLRYKTRDILKVVEMVNQEIENGTIDNVVTFKGLRIPNQALSSNDVFKVKKFLDPILHNAVFIPTEIVAKVGSDFDIDKVSLYFPVPHFGKEISLYQGNDNDIKALQNKLLELEKALILHPSRFKQLLLPNETPNIEESAIAILGKNKKQRKEDVRYEQLILPSKFVENNSAFVGGKQGVGIIATWITFLTKAQISHLEIAQYYGDGIPTKLWFKGLENSYSISNSVTIDDRTIAEAYSELLTSQVDNVKDPVAEQLNIILQTLNPISYMLLRRVPLKTAIKFINVPSISNYLRDQRINESQIAVASNNSIRASKFKQNHLDKYNEKELAPVVITDAILNNPKGHEGFLLSHFMEIVEQAKAITDVKRYLSPDTKYLKDLNSAKAIKALGQRVNELRIVPNFENAFAENSLLSEFKKGRDLYYDLYSQLYITELPEFKGYLDNMKGDLSLNVKGEDSKIKMYNEVNSQFINFIVQNYWDYKVDKFEKLFTGSNSLAKRILAAKIKQIGKSTTLADNLVIQTLKPLLSNSSFRGKDVDNISGMKNKFTSIETNILIESFSELKSLDPELYDDIIAFNIFQSGFDNSPFQMDKVIPYEDQAKVLLNINKGLNKVVFKLDQFRDAFMRYNPKYLPEYKRRFDRSITSPYFKYYVAPSKGVRGKLVAVTRTGDVVEADADGINYKLYNSELHNTPITQDVKLPKPPIEPTKDENWEDKDNDSQIGFCIPKI